MLKKMIVAFVFLFGISIFAQPIVEIKTSKGNIQVLLFSKKAPITVKNFLRYVKAKRYDNTIFHRVIGNFMIQGGGFTAQGNRKPVYAPIKNEANNGISNKEGTIAMARTNVVDSATNQFFINVRNNSFLDHRDNSQRGYGYAVFGKVIKGMNVVNAIKQSQVQPCRFSRNCPVKTITIYSIRRIK